MVVQQLLDSLQRGDSDASRQLLEVTMERLRLLARKILADIPGVVRPGKKSTTSFRTAAAIMACD